MCLNCCCMVLFTITVSFCPLIAFVEGVPPYPVGLYPFNNVYKTTDASCYGNLGGTPQDVELVAGPSGEANTAYKFAGIGTSYINIPGSQHLDTKNSITILVWIFQTGHPGSIIQYLDSNRDNEIQTEKTNSVEIRTSRINSISAIFVERSGESLASLTNDTINLEGKWLYIGASYDHNSGSATLWLDGNSVQQTNIGKRELRTHRDIQVGSGHGKGDSFEGRISCIQIYDRALSQQEVAVVKKRCFVNNHPPVDCRKTSAPSGCGVFMNTLSGTFSSPGYPAGYPHNAKCVWEIKVPSGYFIVLKFSTFRLEASYRRQWPECPDYVIVFDGINSWSNRLLAVCGDSSDVEGEICSSGNGLRVEFVSDKNHSASGFTATYSTSLIDADKRPEDDKIDFSRHYTGIVIGVACAAIFAILSIITYSHTRRRLRERRHGGLTRSNRHSVTLSVNDVFQQNAPPTYDDVMRFPELYPPTPCQGSLANTPAMTPRRGSPVSTPTIPHRLLNRPTPSPTLVPKVGTPIGMPLLNTRRGFSSPQSTSRVSLQRGISPLARVELTPQHSRHADHMSSDGHDDDDEGLPPYPGIMNVDSVLDQVRETLQQGRFASRQASNPSLSDSNSSNANHNRTANGQRDSRASVTVRDRSGVVETRLGRNRNSAASVQSLSNNTHGHNNPWVASKVPRPAVPGGTLRSLESVV